MDQLRLLRRRVKMLWSGEEKLVPAERELHSWQAACVQGGVTYIVGKGGANTFFIKVGEGKPRYMMPDECFERLDTLIDSKYVMYSIGNKKILRKVTSTSEKKLLKEVSDKYVGDYIIGFNPKGKAVRLYRLQGGLRGNEWIKVSK